MYSLIFLIIPSATEYNNYLHFTRYKFTYMIQLYKNTWVGYFQKIHQFIWQNWAKWEIKLLQGGPRLDLPVYLETTVTDFKEPSYNLLLNVF